MFTSHHLPLIKLAYTSNSIEPALPIITSPIVFYPGMRGQTEPRPLCDMRLPPTSYITVESGLTSRVSSSAVLEYDLCVGLCHLQHRQYRPAAAAFERVLTYPTKENGCSKIMVEAHNKWVLVSLLAKGKLEPHPAVSQTAHLAYNKVGSPYLSVAKAFEKPDNAAGLKNQVESIGMQVFAEEGNVSLVREVLAQYQAHHILRLRDVYSKLSIEDIRLLTKSAETGAHLETAGEVETLLHDMISTGMLTGVLTKPPGSVLGDGQGYLTFLSEEEEVDEHLYMEEMLSLKNRIESLGPILTATNERLSTSRDFVKHLVKIENNAKDRSGAGAGGKELDLSYDSQVEDEDLMVG
jgi:COP9 signalosome complex subunit 3